LHASKLAWFYEQNWQTQYLIFAIVCLILFNLIFFLVRRFVHFDVLKKHHDLAGFVIGTLGTLYSVLLGFSIVSAQERLGLIVSKVNEEAYLSADLYRTTLVFPQDTRAHMQNSILSYIDSVIHDEWPLMQQQLESPITLEKLEQLWALFYQFQPQTEQEKIWFNQAITTLTALNSARLERIYSSWDTLNTLSQLALFGGGLVLISFLLFFGTENLLSQLAINGLFIIYLAFMMYVVYSLDKPFSNSQPIQPKAYEIIYNYYTQTRGKPLSPEIPPLPKRN